MRRWKCGRVRKFCVAISFAAMGNLLRLCSNFLAALVVVIRTRTSIRAARLPNNRNWRRYSFHNLRCRVLFRFFNRIELIRVPTYCVRDAML